MAQTAPLINILKKTLKTHGKTYADVADALELTEASVKRLFSEKSFSLRRLDRICQMMEMEISDLVQLMNDDQHQINQLTEEQEQEIASDPLLMLIAICLLNHWTVGEILESYAIRKTDCVRKLAKLDRLKFIDLLPNNRVKLRVAPNFKWLEGGPIQRFFLSRVEAEFFNSRFDQQTELLVCINGMLSDTSNAVLQRRMQRLASEFTELNNDDANLSLEQRHGTTMVLALRKWEYGVFAKLKRREKT